MQPLSNDLTEKQGNRAERIQLAQCRISTEELGALFEDRQMTEGLKTNDVDGRKVLVVGRLDGVF